jgi:hypothetical protein
VDAVTKVISFTKPFAVSCSCGKILSPSQVHWLKNVDENFLGYSVKFDDEITCKISALHGLEYE